WRAARGGHHFLNLRPQLLLLSRSQLIRLLVAHDALGDFLDLLHLFRRHLRHLSAAHAPARHLTTLAAARRHHHALPTGSSTRSATRWHAALHSAWRPTAHHHGRHGRL